MHRIPPAEGLGHADGRASEGKDSASNLDLREARIARCNPDIAGQQQFDTPRRAPPPAKDSSCRNRDFDPRMTRPNFEARDRERDIAPRQCSAPGAKCHRRNAGGESKTGLRLN